jgi:hypothetical protein
MGKPTIKHQAALLDPKPGHGESGDEERSRIAAAEAQKAKRLVAIDVDAGRVMLMRRQAYLDHDEFGENCVALPAVARSKDGFG